MTHPLAAEARRLRTEEELSTRQIRERLGIGRELLQEILRGIPPPDWTRRPNAKDDLRARAVELRGQGRSVNAIADELGVSKSTAYLWVRHLPFDKDPEAERARRQAHAKVMTDARWGGYRVARDELETGIRDKAAQWVGRLKERELVLAGAVLYWSEGAKSKPWRQQHQLDFTNSDPGLVELFIRFVEALGVDRRRLTYRVSIHESADALAASRWWADRIGVDVGEMRRPTLKRHKPVTNRHNTGDGYHGCLVVKVPRSRRLYVRIEGLMAGVFADLARK
ncbi:helix-turn-helix domain-containing protein [Phytohabitans sp. ZYX-F-186]|uniref:Helix-turn-helix domain-containing protein n=1 Tax=Phytohabitans maris TaxID=3071409 RepID=A0ABU0ZWU6_9ACTN|nr:helix-turn-helix domain-containing protein [Phytohabitans sp. ZYX-F-186]MDQ7910967.1 helix-turn-helix domain-containing protein [Phytohabitans sp. ZYX-F-186]